MKLSPAQLRALDLVDRAWSQGIAPHASTFRSPTYRALRRLALIDHVWRGDIAQPMVLTTKGMVALLSARREGAL